MNRAIFPGTFDPFTIGHESIVRRALTFIDEVIIAIGLNEQKHSLFPVEKREQMIRDLYKDEPRVKVISRRCSRHASSIVVNITTFENTR